MADEKILTENDDDIDIVEVDELPPAGAEPKAVVEDDKAKPAESDDDDDEDEDDGDDARLADKDGEDDGNEAEKKKRQNRRLRQKEARDRTLNELAELRAFKQQAEQRFAALETSSTATTAAQVEQRLAEARADIKAAEQIIAAAIKNGEGEDAILAMEIRDAAKAREMELAKVKDGFDKVRTTTTTPAIKPKAVELAGRWKSSNPWYDPSGGNEDSAIVNAIDNRLTAEGFDPATEDYWVELTKRVTKRLAPEAAPKDGAAPRKKAPPQGNGREHAPQSTRKEVYVTPERKQAMIDAGVWDDPVARTRMLKAYAQYDRDARSAG